MRKPARALIVVALACAVIGGGAEAAGAATQQYPDLRTLPPRDLRLDVADITADGSGVFHNVLRFSNTVWNNGPGKLVMRGTINPQTSDGTAYQRVYDDAGGYTDYPVGRFYYHAAHNHYHYDNWGRYQLFTKAEYDTWVAQGKPRTLPSGVDIGTKTTSCVMDEEFIKGIPGTPFPGVFPSSGCMPDGGALLLEGISQGWGDTYDYWRYEQWIDVGNQKLPDGDYVLRSVTDDNNQVYESAGKADPIREGEVDNEGITKLRISGGALVDQNPPSGTVAINDVDAQTRSTSVTVKVLGRDDMLGPNDSEGVDQVRVSNNGSAWKTYSYTGKDSTPQAIAWNLADPAYGGTSSGGIKTVYAQFHDRAGNWSQTETDTIDYAAPAPPSQYSQAVTADSPVSYWRLAETSGTQAFDERASNGATYVNSPTLGAASLLSGETNKAVTLDGINDYAVAAHTTSMDLTSKVTLEAWIKPTAIPAAGQFASVLTKPESYSLQFNGPKLEFTVIQSGTRRRVQAVAGAIVAGSTYHVVGTFDGTTQRLYLNGAQVATQALSGSASVVSWSNLYLGSWDGTQEFFKGTIDEAAIYDTVLSAARVQAHYSAAAGAGTPPPPPTVIATPTGLAASPASPYAIDVRWTDNATNESNYVLERSADASFSAPKVITLAADATSYADSGLTPSTTYWYRVKATAGSASSAYSSVVSAATPAPPQINSYSQTVLGDGPSAYWRVGETSGTIASDQKTSNPGTYVNLPALGQASLLTSDTQNRAVGLDGTNDHVRVPAAPALNLTSQITLEAWIKPTTIPAVGFESILTKQESYTLQFNGGRLEFTIVGPSSARKRLQAPSGAVVAGQRYHVVGTFDGQTQRLYLNGTQVGTAAFAGTASIADWSNLYVGSWDGASEFFSGTVDEPAVYSRVLTATQVKAHYDSGIAAPPAGA